MNKDISYEELIASVIKTSREAIESGVQQELQQHLINQLSYSVREQIGLIANEFIEKELKSEILETLRQAKIPILSAVKEGIVQTSAKLAEVLYTKALNNLTASSYKSGEIIKKLFE